MQNKTHSTSTRSKSQQTPVPNQKPCIQRSPGAPEKNPCFVLRICTQSMFALIQLVPYLHCKPCSAEIHLPRPEAGDAFLGLAVASVTGIPSSPSEPRGLGGSGFGWTQNLVEEDGCVQPEWSKDEDVRVKSVLHCTWSCGSEKGNTCKTGQSVVSNQPHVSETTSTVSRCTSS